MFIKVLKAGRSAKSALDYNEKKVLSGEASFLEGFNINNYDENNSVCLYRTFEEYEDNKAVARQVRARSFHTVVSPTEGESEEMNILVFIKDMLDNIGYRDQPTAIYRHEDVARTHYHIVCSRIQKDGKIVDSHFEGRRIQDFLRQVKDEYKFNVSVEIEKEPKKDVLADMAVPQGFVYGEKNWTTKALKLIMDTAENYTYSSIDELAAALNPQSINIYSYRADKTGEDVLCFEALDKEGKQCSRRMSAKSLSTPNDYLSLMSSITSNMTEEKPAVSRQLEYVASEVIGHTSNIFDIIRLLEACGYNSRLEMSDNKRKITKFFIVDPFHKTVYPGEQVSDVFAIDSVNELNYLNKGVMDNKTIKAISNKILKQIPKEIVEKKQKVKVKQVSR